MRNAVRYREYLPCAALRRSARSFFTFVEPSNESSDKPVERSAVWELQFRSGERLCAPTFADGHACIVFYFEKEYCPDGVWRRGSGDSSAVLLGPMTKPGPSVAPHCRESVGVYLQPGSTLAGVALGHLENRAIPLRDIWGEHAQELCERLNETQDESLRIGLLEQALLRRIGHPPFAESHAWLPKMAAWINARNGRLTVDQMTEAVGLSRQHFTRVFHQGIGISPKLYGELARFQAALGHLGSGVKDNWAQVAVAAGYSDQSHMISEFRRFSGLTPGALQNGRWFHPFMERSTRRSPTSL